MPIGDKICKLLLYADDILLITPSVTALQKLLLVCETELNYLDMTINSKKNLVAYELGQDMTKSVRILSPVMAVIWRGWMNCATWESLLYVPLSSDVHWNTLSDPFTVQL